MRTKKQRYTKIKRSRRSKETICGRGWRNRGMQCTMCTMEKWNLCTLQDGGPADCCAAFRFQIVLYFSWTRYALCFAPFQQISSLVGRRGCVVVAAFKDIATLLSSSNQSNVVVTVGIPEANNTPCGNKLAFSIYVPKTNTTTCRSQATSCIEVTIVKNAGFFPSVFCLPFLPHTCQS